MLRRSCCSTDALSAAAARPTPIVGKRRAFPRCAQITARGVQRHSVPTIGGRLLGYFEIDPNNRSLERYNVITLGVILLVLGLLLKISILTTIGSILLLVGVVLFVFGRLGTKVGGRSHWF